MCTFAAVTTTSTERSDRIAAAVRAVVDQAPPLTTETVQRLGQLMEVPLALPGDTDPVRAETLHAAS